MQEKVCSSCGANKPLEDFHKDRNRPDGRRSACKECRSQKNFRPESAVLPPMEPPPMDEDKLRQLARVNAIRRLVEYHFPQFRRLYSEELSKLELQRKWYSVSGDDPTL